MSQVKRKFAELYGANVTRSPGMFLVEVLDEVWGMDIIFVMYFPHSCSLSMTLGIEVSYETISCPGWL
jgi:hypothetical protein